MSALVSGLPFRRQFVFFLLLVLFSPLPRYFVKRIIDYISRNDTHIPRTYDSLTKECASLERGACLVGKGTVRSENVNLLETGWDALRALTDSAASNLPNANSQLNTQSTDSE